MKANFDGYCVDCRDPIHRGDEVAICIAWRSTVHDYCELGHHIFDEKGRPLSRVEPSEQGEPNA